MSAIPLVDRTAIINPVSRRDPAHPPAAGDHPGGRGHSAGRDPQGGRHDPPAADEVPAIAPLAPESRLGQIVNTFAV